MRLRKLIGAGLLIATAACSQQEQPKPAAPGNEKGTEKPAAQAAVTTDADGKIDLSQYELAGEMDGRLAILRVPNVRGVVEAVEEALKPGMPGTDPELIARLGGLLQDPGLEAFPDDAGLAMILMTGEMPVNVIVLEVDEAKSDGYAQLLAAQGMVTETVGGLLVAAPTQETLDAVRGEIAKTAGLEGSGAGPITLDVNVEALAAQFGPMAELKIQETVDSIVAFQALAQQQDAQAMPPGGAADVAKILEMEMRGLYNVVSEIRTLRLSFDMTPQGLRIDKTVTAMPGTNLAKLMAAPRPKADETVAAIAPGDSVMRFAAPSINSSAMMEFFESEMKAVAEAMQLPGDEIKGVMEMMAASKAIYGSAMGGSMMPIGGPMTDGSWAVRIEDPAAALAFLEELPGIFEESGMFQFYEDLGMSMELGFQSDVSEYDGVSIHEMSVSVNLPQMSQDPMMAMMKDVKYHIACVDDILVYAIGDQSVEKLIDAAKTGQYAGAEPLYAQTIYAPAANGYFDFDLSGYMQSVVKMISAQPGQEQVAMQMTMAANMFNGVKPLAGAWSISPEAIHGSVMIPGELIARLGGQAMMIMQMSGAMSQSQTPAPAQNGDPVGQAQSGMRSLATALESYNLDYGVYPPEVTPHLTTPIAYMTEIPVDPFSATGEVYQYVQEAEGWLLYSIGPDGVDDGGQTEYDPMSGPAGPGDIVRHNL